MQPHPAGRRGVVMDDTFGAETDRPVALHRYCVMNPPTEQRVRIDQRRWTAAEGWPGAEPHGVIDSPQLVLCFAATSAFGEARSVADLRALYPDADIVGCSTAGEICGTEVTDDTAVSTAVQFDHTRVRVK